MTRVLTLRQPHASLVAAGIKDIENRSWDTRHRGPLLIHAGLGRDRIPDDELASYSPEARAIVADPDLPHGAIIARVELIGTVTDSDSPWACRGENHWVLTDAQPLAEPIPATGRLGLWRFDSEATA